MDLFMIIGARRKIKAFLVVWLIVAFVRLIIYIYNSIKIGSSSMVLLGVNIGAFFLVSISCVPVLLSIYKLDDERQRILDESELTRKFIEKGKINNMHYIGK